MRSSGMLSEAPLPDSEFFIGKLSQSTVIGRSPHWRLPAEVNFMFLQGNVATGNVSWVFYKNDIFNV